MGRQIHDSVLAQGIAAAKAGDKSTARRMLTQAVRHDPDSEAAWIWLSSVLDTTQGRAFCLQKVLALNPQNVAASKGLAALDSTSPAPAVVARPSPVAAVPPTRPRRRPRVRDRTPAQPLLAGIVRRRQFWQVIVACLAVIALGLVGVLAYAAFNGASADGEEVLAAIAPSPTPWPRGTLRPTFTATPTQTPVPTFTSTPTPTWTSTPTPTPTEPPTPTHTPVPTQSPRPTSQPRARTTSPTATSRPAAAPRPAPQARSLDPRLSDLGVRIEPAFVGEGKPYWRLVKASWTNERESGGKHSVYVEVLDANGNRAIGQPVVVKWADGNVILPVENKPPPDWGVNFPMYSTLGSYSVSLGGAPSDRVVGLGLGTVEAPRFTVHTCFYLTFRLTYR